MNYRNYLSLFSKFECFLYVHVCIDFYSVINLSRSSDDLKDIQYEARIETLSNQSINQGC